MCGSLFVVVVVGCCCVVVVVVFWGGSEGLRDCVYVGARLWMQGRGGID